MVVDTIFALSSGAPPAAIAVVRISGPEAGAALRLLAGQLPEPRRATYRRLHDLQQSILDHALVLWLPGPHTATGENIAELHLHGGRAVVRAVENALLATGKLRRATAGEFTRRAFANGRIDLAEAEGLADLLSAETELQHRSALAMAGGAFSAVIEAWRDRLLDCSAQVEAVLDFADEDDAAELSAGFGISVAALCSEIGEWLDRPTAETLREGFRVVIAGPPNAGKSSLFNALVDSEAAITAPIAGTTRDVLTRSVALSGIPFTFVDTAGLREHTADAIEAIGVARARTAADDADLVLWLGPEGEGPQGSWEIESFGDLPRTRIKPERRHLVSACGGEGIDDLRADLVRTAASSMPRPGQAALNHRQRALMARAKEALEGTKSTRDPLLLAEHLREARQAFDSLIGRTSTEDMLDALFGRFCIGK